MSLLRDIYEVQASATILSVFRSFLILTKIFSAVAFLGAIFLSSTAAATSLRSQCYSNYNNAHKVLV
jgi:hypothetical protein